MENDHHYFVQTGRSKPVSFPIFGLTGFFGYFFFGEEKGGLIVLVQSWRRKKNAACRIMEPSYVAVVFCFVFREWWVVMFIIIFWLVDTKQYTSTLLLAYCVGHCFIPFLLRSGGKQMMTIGQYRHPTAHHHHPWCHHIVINCKVFWNTTFVTIIVEICSAVVAL